MLLLTFVALFLNTLTYWGRLSANKNNGKHMSEVVGFHATVTQEVIRLNISDFNLSGGCFGNDIIQKCTKWSQIGVHGLIIGQVFAKFQCASDIFAFVWPKFVFVYIFSNQIAFFVKNNLREARRAIPKLEKNNLSDII